MKKQELGVVSKYTPEQKNTQDLWIGFLCLWIATVALLSVPFGWEILRWWAILTVVSGILALGMYNFSDEPAGPVMRFINHPYNPLMIYDCKDDGWHPAIGIAVALPVVSTILIVEIIPITLLWIFGRR